MADSGEVVGDRDPDAGREADDYGPGAGGKKRKVPVNPQIADKDENIDHLDSDGEIDKEIPIEYPHVSQPRFRSNRSRAAKAVAFRKALFLRRKAALDTLYRDAQAAIVASTARVVPNKSVIPDSPAFEKLILSLEGVGVNDWPPDSADWRSDSEVEKSIQSSRLGAWRTAYSVRRRIRISRSPVVRGGWAPEGSFEVDMTSKASNGMQARGKDQAVLRKLVVDLRSVLLSMVKPLPPPPALPSDEKPPIKSRRTIEAKPEPATSAESVHKPDKSSPPMESVSSKDNSELGLGKKKPKKKKRSVLANQSNPHHVNNYRPSRTVSPHDESYAPYAQHLSLLFPPPLRLLSARPQRRTAPLPGVAAVPRIVRPSEEDYICCFCETALFFGTEKARKRAIRRRRAELKRKEVIRTKAKNVAEGKGGLRDDDDDDYEDDACGDDDGHGRCSCGRALSGPHGSGKSPLKPPEPDPDPDPLGLRVPA